MKNKQTTKLLNTKTWYLILFLASIIKNIYPTKVAHEVVEESFDSLANILAISPMFGMIVSLLFSAVLSAIIFEIIINGVYNLLYTRNMTINQPYNLGKPMQFTSKLPYSENFKQPLRVAYVVSNVIIGCFSLLGFLNEWIIAYGLNILTAMTTILSYLLAYKFLKNMLRLGTRAITFKYLYLGLCAYFMVINLLSFKILDTAFIVIGIISALAIAAIAVICEKVILPRIRKEEQEELSRILTKADKPDAKPEQKEVFKGFGF